MTSKSHVLFDFFGTLVRYSESRIDQGYSGSYRLLALAGSRLSYEEFLQVWEALWQGFEASAERSLDEYSMNAVCTAFLRRAIAREPEPSLMLEFRDQYLEEWNKGVEYLAEVPQLLADLSRRHVLALVTNTHHAGLIDAHLERMRIRQYFSAVVTSVEHGKRKPSPSIFAHALQLVAGTAAGTVYVGDSYAADYSGATSAGIDCLLIDPRGRHEIPAAARIDRVGDVLSRLGAGGPALD